MAKLNAAKPDAGIQITAQVEREIAAVAKKIRFNDLLTGAALLLVGTLAYAVVAILLDKWLTLPAWSRQLGFVGFLTTILGLAYFAIVRPLTRTVNPRYVARQVEATMPESKNELINWVDLQEQDMATSVKSALADRAAAGFGDADVDSAVRSKKFLWLGGTAAVLFAVLAVLFLVFKGTQFSSLLSRAFNPFQSNTAIAARTTIEVVEPTELDATVADGDQIRFAVRLFGRVPDAAGGDKVRLKVRYSADAADVEEIAFAKADTLRDFELVLTRGTIQNGFWYTIAAGDAETAEHRVTVRTKPMLKGFEINYEYPAYLRIAPSSNTDPKLRGYPGTKVRLQVQTNRDVKAGSMTIEPRGEVVEGQIFDDKNLRFAKTLDRAGQYRIAFASSAGESSGSSIPYPIEILPDYSPLLSIDKPTTESITLATNGLLEVDGVVTDDFGIENTTLQFSLVSGPKIAGKQYLNPAGFKRATDGTYPTRVDYKDSVKLDQLKDDTGKTVALRAGQVLEFWLEAKDNCTVLPHELGKSKKFVVNLVAPPAKPDEVKKQDQQVKDRQRQDREHQQQEKNKQDNEPRAAPQDPNQKGEPKNQAEPPMDPNGPKPEPKVNPDAQPGDKGVEDKAKELQNKIDEKNQQAGEAKANPDAEKPDGAEPPKAGEKKPGEGEPGADSKPGEGAEQDPMAKPSEDKGPGKVQPPEPSKDKPAPNQKSGDESRPEAQPTGDGPKPAPKPEDKPGEQKAKPEGMQPMEQPKPGEKPKEEQAGGGKNEQPEKSDAKPQPAQAKPDGQQQPGEQKEAPKTGDTGEEKAKPEERPADGKGDKPADSGSKKDEPKGAPPKDTGMEKPAPETDPKPGEGASNEKGGDPKDAKGEEKSTQKPGGKKPTKDEIDKLTKDAQDLNSTDQEKKKNAEESLDKAVGKQNREKLQDDMKKRDAETQKKLEEGAKQQGGKEPSQEELEQLKKDAKDLDNADPEKRKAAQDKLDKSVGKENREKLQREMDGSKGEDRKKIEGDADQLPRDSKTGETQPKPPTKEDIDELAKKKNDLNSPDPDKKKAAEEKFDKAVGQDAREQMQKDMKDRAAADQKKLEDAAKKEAEKNPASPMKQPTKEELEKLAQDAKDLNSPDAGKKKAAEEKVDKAVGQDAREQLQKDMKDRAAADQKKLEDAAKQAGNPKPKEPTKEEIEQLANDAKDLNSTDAAKKKAAEEKLDKAVGEDARKQLQKDMKDRDAAKADADKKKLEDAAKQAAKAEADKTPGAEPKEPTKEEVDKLAQAAKDLDSPDAGKKAAAEKQLDDSVGKPAREQLQKEMKDLKGDDPKKAQEAKDRLEKLAKQWQPGNGSKGQDGKPIVDNPENRLKAAELQLDDFKKYKGNKDFLKENNMSEAEYEKFLKGYEELVNSKRQDAEQTKLNPGQTRPAGPTSVGANDGSGGRVIGGPTAGTAPGAGGPSFAPPGFSEAQRDFAKEAREALEQSKKPKK